MHSKDFLAQELARAGLNDMAMRAATGWYHDFLSPLDLPCQQLDLDLVRAAENGFTQAMELRQRHHAGEFDATSRGV